MSDTHTSQKGWIIAGSAAMVVIFLMSSWRVVGGTASAPSSYPATCASCNHETHIDTDLVAQLSFARMHPKQFHEAFPNMESPLGQQCAACAVIHSDFTVTVCPRTGKRFVLLREANTREPITEESIAAVSPF